MALASTSDGARTLGLTSHLDSFLDELMSAWAVPGLALVIRSAAGGEEIVFRGMADREAAVPVSDGTVFRIGSITKSLTALAVLRQVEAGHMDLHAPVTEYLPWFRVRGMRRSVTLHELLSHTSGMTKWVWFHPSALAEVIGLASTRLSNRGGYRYSTVGYAVIQLALEHVTGRSYSDLLRVEVLEPAGMIDSFPHVTNEIRGRLAKGYSPLDDRRPWHPMLPLGVAPWMEWIHGGGSAAATIGDMSSYLAVLLASGEPVVARSSFDAMTAPVLGMRNGSGYGYGMNVYDAPSGARWLYHTGGNPGFGSALIVDRDAGVAVAALCNFLSFRFFAPWEIAAATCDLAAAFHRSASLPEPPQLANRSRVPKPDSYAGYYRGPSGDLTFEQRGEQLDLVWRNERVALEWYEDDVLYPLLPEPSMHLVRFEREDGEIVGVSWGPDWFVRDGVKRRYAEIRDEWRGFPGRYRCYRPWAAEFEVVSRRTGLALIVGGEFEVPLRHMTGRRFRIAGEAEFLPQEIVFGPELAGKASSVRCDGYEVFRYARA